MSLRFKRILIILFLIFVFVISNLMITFIDFSVFGFILSAIFISVLESFSLSSSIFLMIIAGYYIFKP